jgi:nucleoside-diphosphate-sugar epimerase
MKSDYLAANCGFEDIFTPAVHSLDISCSLEPASILLTGAQGMVGNGLSKALIHLKKNGKLSTTKLYLASRHWETKFVDNYSEGSDCFLIKNQNITDIRGPIELVIHTASPSNITKIGSYEELQEVNLGIMRKLQKLQPKRVIFISSGEVYGGKSAEESQDFHGFTKTKKRDWYPLAKLEAEFEVKEYAIRNASSASIIRLFHTFGPGVKRNDGRSFADILWNSVTLGQIELYSDGSQVRSFLYLADAIEAMLKVALSQESGVRVVNLGSNIPHTVYEFAQLVSGLTGSPIKIKTQSEFLHSPNGYVVPALNAIYNYSWEPKIEIMEGIRRTLGWMTKSISICS